MIPECLRPLGAEEYASVRVPTHEEIRALLRGAGDELRAMARRDRDPTPLRGSAEPPRLGPPHRAGPALPRAGVRSPPTRRS